MVAPRGTVLLSAALITVLLTALVYGLSLMDLGGWGLVGFALLTFLISFASVRYFFGRDIYSRLLPIYRIISGMTTTESVPRESEMMQMPLEQTEKKVQDWADERIVEIRGLQARDDYRQEFIGNLAHELKTPLFNVQGFVSSLLEGAVEDMAVRERFLLKALKNVERMTRILEDLDDISHLETGRLQMNIQTVDLAQIAREVMSSLEDQAADRSIRLSVKSTGGVMVKADGFRMGQVFTNLMNNAILYGRQGGEVVVSFTDFDNKYLVEVSDDGPGIAPEKLPRLFERFYRVDASRSRDVGGTGLGLAIVKHILEGHGQNVSAKSVVGQGATFSFSLPKGR